MKMIYKEKYSIIDQSMSDLNIGARKNKNIHNHIFVVNSIFHNVLKKKSNKPIDIMVFTRPVSMMIPLLFLQRLTREVELRSTWSIKKGNFEDIVMHGHVLAPLISSL
jgi:hypothetical protein